MESCQNTSHGVTESRYLKLMTRVYLNVTGRLISLTECLKAKSTLGRPAARNPVVSSCKDKDPDSTSSGNVS